MYWLKSPIRTKADVEQLSAPEAAATRGAAIADDYRPSVISETNSLVRYEPSIHNKFFPMIKPQPNQTYVIELCSGEERR